MSQTRQRQKIRDQIAGQIKELITSGQLEPGAKLPTELELAERFGVSRLSIREATKALEFLGIVASKTGVGLTVGELDLARITDHLGFHPALHHADPHQLIDSRVIIETGVLPHVARQMAADASIAASLQELVDGFRSARTLRDWIRLDIQFHRRLLEASGLQPLIAFGDLLQVFFQRFRDSVKKAEWQAGIASHQRIVDYLKAGDVPGAVTELRTHIESHRERIG